VRAPVRPRERIPKREAEVGRWEMGEEARGLSRERIRFMGVESFHKQGHHFTKEATISRKRPPFHRRPLGRETN
jgi:hypothetical protein